MIQGGEMGNIRKHVRGRGLFGALAALCLVPGVAHADAPAAPGVVPPPPPVVAATKCKHANGQSVDVREARDMTYFVGLHACWDADETNELYRNVNDLYVHWTLQRYEPTEAETDRPRDYAREHVPGLIRLFVGENRSFLTTLRIDMHNPDLTFSIPLTSFGYQGKVGKGEAWVTEVDGDDQSQPWFRAGPYSAATVTVTAKSTKDLEVRAAGTVLKTIKSLAGLAAPGGPLLTTLNSAAFSGAASQLDDALTNIWSQSVDEKQVSGRALSEWYRDGYFLVEVVMPPSIRVGSDSAEPQSRWYKLQLSCPRGSIFSPAPNCLEKATGNTNAGNDWDRRTGYHNAEFVTSEAPIFYHVSPEQVLNFVLAPNKTLISSLQDQTWYSNFLRGGDAGNEVTPATAATAPDAAAAAPQQEEAQKPVQTTRTRTKEDYAKFCRAAVTSLYASGLSAFDARLGLWAAVYGSLDFAGLHQEFQGTPECTVLLPGGPAGKWQFAYEKAKDEGLVDLKAGAQHKAYKNKSTRKPKR